MTKDQISQLKEAKGSLEQETGQLQDKLVKMEARAALLEESADETRLQLKQTTTQMTGRIRELEEEVWYVS